MHACYIPTQVADRDRLEDVYTALNWILSGSYAAAITPLRGYVTGRPDLGKQYAEEHELGPNTAKAIDGALSKLDVKFAKGGLLVQRGSRTSAGHSGANGPRTQRLARTGHRCSRQSCGSAGGATHRPVESGMPQPASLLRTRVASQSIASSSVIATR